MKWYKRVVLSTCDILINQSLAFLECIGRVATSIHIVTEETPISFTLRMKSRNILIEIGLLPYNDICTFSRNADTHSPQSPVSYVFSNIRSVAPDYLLKYLNYIMPILYPVKYNNEK